MLAFPQADVEVPVFMEIPVGIDIADGERRSYALRLNKNLYGLRQASLTWFQLLSKGLEKRGFQESKVDPLCFLS